MRVDDNENRIHRAQVRDRSREVVTKDSIADNVGGGCIEIEEGNLQPLRPQEPSGASNAYIRVPQNDLFLRILFI